MQIKRTISIEVTITLEAEFMDSASIAAAVSTVPAGKLYVAVADRLRLSQFGDKPIVWIDDNNPVLLTEIEA